MCCAASRRATIAQLHAIDYRAIGLADYGRPGNFFERQIGRWSRQYRKDVEAGRDETMDRIIAWLEANIPAEDDMTTLAHGDFQIDNLIFHPTEPRVLAVLDWELSTLGHPGADFAYHAMMYRMPPHIVAGLAGADIAALGIPSEEAYLAAYCARTGRDGMAGYDYYIAFNFFRIAAIKVAPALDRIGDFRAFLGEAFDEALTYAALRHAETIGRPVGSREWLEDMERRSGLSLTPGKRGPKAKAI